MWIGVENMVEFSGNLNEILLSFSLLLDVAENKPFQHTKKVAYIAMEIVKKMDKPQLLEHAFQGAILHDIGVTHSLLLQGKNAFITAETTNRHHHVSTGWEVAKELPLDEEIPEIIKYHHERWDGSGIFGLVGNETPFLSQVIHLADQLELRFDGTKDGSNHRNEIRQWLESEKGKTFNDEIVDVTLSLLEKDKMWIDLGNYDIQSSLIDRMPNRRIEVNISQMEKIARAFSIIIDKKSAFTHKHSQGVSERAYLTGKALGYDEDKCVKLRIAGYLHDLGKLVVPNEILDKPDKLQSEEILVIKKHSYYTKFILKQIFSFKEIAEWAGNHHENLLGTGYPEGLKGVDLTEESQIIALSDIYQALTEDRIYRKGLGVEEALKMLGKLVNEGYYSKELFKTFCSITS